ncbi:hypothetical protein IJ425_07085 [bacterium]|nr:hypothetical protein [bacterium]
MNKREAQIKKLMDLRGYSEEEATQIVLDDEATDRGVIHPWNLSKEQEKANRKARQVDKADREKKAPVKRERKADNEKQELINLFIEALENEASNIEVLNKEREVEFIYKERKFKITLSAPRK